MRQEGHNRDMQVHFQNIVCELLLLSFAKDESLPDQLLDDLNFLLLIVFLHVESVSEATIAHNLTEEERLKDRLILTDHC